MKKIYLQRRSGKKNLNDQHLVSATCLIRNLRRYRRINGLRPASFFRHSLPSMYTSRFEHVPPCYVTATLSRAIIILHRREYDFYRGKDTSPTTRSRASIIGEDYGFENLGYWVI